MSCDLTNPFGLVFTGLWTMALRHPYILKTVRPGNRIRFDDANRNPEKESVLSADLPEMTLVSESSNANLLDSSSSSRINRTYSFIIVAGDLRINEVLTPLEWALFCALADAHKVLSALKYKDKPFVKRIVVPSIATGLSDEEKNRNIKGWSSIWQCELEMHFKTSDLASELMEPSNDSA